MPDVQIAKIRVRQGPDAERKQVILETGELGFSTDTHRLVVGNGVVYGGVAAGAKSFVVSGAAPVPNGILPGDYVFNATTSAVSILPTDFDTLTTPTWADFYNINQGFVSVSGSYLTQSAGNVIYLTPNSIDGNAISPSLFQTNNPVELNGGQIRLKYNTSHFTSGANGLTLNQVPGNVIVNESITFNKLDPFMAGNGIILDTGTSQLRAKIVDPLILTVDGIGLSASNQFTVAGGLKLVAADGGDVTFTNIPGGALTNLGYGLTTGPGNSLQLSATAPIDISSTGGITLLRSNEFSTSAGSLYINTINGGKITAGTLPLNALHTSAIGTTLTNSPTLDVVVQSPLSATTSGVVLKFDSTLQVVGDELGVVPGSVSVANFSGFDTSAFGNGLTATSGTLNVNTFDVIYSSPLGVGLNFSGGLSSNGGVLVVNGVDGTMMTPFSIGYNQLSSTLFGDGLTATSGVVSIATNGVLTAGPAGVSINIGTGLSADTNTLVVNEVPGDRILFGTLSAEHLDVLPLTGWQSKFGGMVPSPTTPYNLSGTTLSGYTEAVITITEPTSFTYGLTANVGISVAPSVIWGAKLPAGVIHAQTRAVSTSAVDVTLYNASPNTVSLGNTPFRIVCVTDGSVNQVSL